MRTRIRSDRHLRRTWLTVIIAGATASLSATGNAQSQSQIPLTTAVLREDGSYQQLPARRGGFSLFAEEDLAGTSIRTTGIFRYTPINGGGLCAFANTAGDIFNTSCGEGAFFHHTASWGIGPDDYLKIREAHPPVANMRAPVGYSTPWRITSIAPITTRIGPADGQFGQYYAGATSLDGAGCREFTGRSGGGLPDNFTLTASADCPETWAATGFDGVHEIPDSVWLKRFQANPAAFRWDDWKIPRTEYSDKPLGTNATYGAFSDYPREVLQLYGGITPRGVQGDPPGERGFPLGIFIRYDAWKFDRPSIRNGAFIRWLIINNSEKVWGTGIDYDKLYVGMDPGYILSGQSPAANNIPAVGAHVASGGGFVSGRCTNSFPKRMPPGVNDGCEGNRTTRPTITMWLKSPLGDLRNKLFNDPTSPYFFPAHPEADDTITFNQWRRGGFGAQEQFSWRRSDRALFGLLSGDEEHWLDGRQFTDFSASQIWTYFRYEFTDGTQSLANLRYNRSVPGDIAGYGKWDYNDDGIQDTLKLPDCGAMGCSGLWGDSIAGGFSNQQAGNIGNFLGAGPIALAAGDTAEFIFYFGQAEGGDTTGMNRLIAAVTNAYFKNYAGAAAYPTPVFTPADVQLNSAWFRDSTANAQNTEIRIQVKMPPVQDDEFIKSVLNRLLQDDPIATNLRNLNPELVETVRGRMQQNLAQVLIFKSCDNGVSWADASDCTAATANYRTRDQDGSEVGLGWQPRFTLNADSIDGQLSSYVISDVVQSGREYLYSAVTKTRGLFDIAVTTDLDVDAQGRVLSQTVQTLQDVLGVDIDSITSPLAPNGPFTVRAYAPISVPAGTIYARLDTSRVQELTTTNRVTPLARSATVTGTFRMRFGNRFILTRTLDTVTNARTTTLIRQSLYSSAATSPAGPRLPSFVAAADTFVSDHGITFGSDSRFTLRATPRFTTGTVQTFVDTITRTGYVLANGSGGSQAYYLAVSGSTTNFSPAGNSGLQQNTQEFESAPWFPGFTATMVSETVPPQHRVNNVVLRPERGPADTANTGNVSSFGVVWSAAASNANPPSASLMGASPGGHYRIEWLEEAWGGLGNNLRLTTVEEMQPLLDAALASREVGTVADTTEALKAQVLSSARAATFSSRPLVPAKLPFRIIGLNAEPVSHVLMLQRHATGNAVDSLFRNSRMLGTAGDTVRLNIPPDVWMPGDSLYVFENLTVDSTATVSGVANTRIVRDTVVNGQAQQLPIQIVRDTFSLRMALTCVSNSTPTRTTCNPITLGTKGGTGYLPYEPGWVNLLHLNRIFDQNSEVQLVAQPIQASALPLTKRDMDLIHVVPNPFIVQSGYDKLTSGRAVDYNAVRFVNVPSAGMMRIYSVSGQLMQQLSWTESDLIASGNGSPHGDLEFNLRTREGLDLGSGLYVFVLTARGANANGQVARGKFVVIR